MTEKLILKKKDIENIPENRFIHPFNDKAVRNTKSLGDLVGLSKVGIHLVRIESGDETTQHHNHECSDEFVYILSGNASLELGDEFFQLEAGDFVGFPAKGATHSMQNTSECDLTYIMGGSRTDNDCCNYPKINRRMFKINGQSEYVDTNHLSKLS